MLSGIVVDPDFTGPIDLDSIWSVDPDQDPWTKMAQKKLYLMFKEIDDLFKKAGASPGAQKSFIEV
jgi:hypothetical protein